MKALFVCVDRYPYDGACTSLLKKMFFEGGLSTTENEIHIATYQYHFSDLEMETIDSVKIHRFLSARYLSISELIKNRKRLDFLISGIIIKVKRKVAFRFHDGISLDGGQIKEFGRDLKKLCKSEHFDVIVGVAGCYEITFAAQKVSKALHIPFILYQVDPYAENIMLSQKEMPQRLRMETELYRSSAKVFTTEIIRNRMEELIGKENLNNVEVMEFPGVSIEPRPNKNSLACSESNKIICVFTGRVYKGVRNPLFTMKLFCKLPEQFHLKLYGVSKEELKEICPNLEITNNIECCGLVSVEEAEHAIHNADILVNIGNIMINQVPSKLFSYISTGKPILNVCANKECPSKRYLKSYPCALSIDEKQDCSKELTEKVAEFLKKNAGKTCDLRRIAILYEKCTPIYAAKQMKDAFIYVSKER